MLPRFAFGTTVRVTAQCAGRDEDAEREWRRESAGVELPVSNGCQQKLDFCQEKLECASHMKLPRLDQEREKHLFLFANRNLIGIRSLVVTLCAELSNSRTSMRVTTFQAPLLPPVAIRVRNRIKAAASHTPTPAQFDRTSPSPHFYCVAAPSRASQVRTPARPRAIAPAPRPAPQCALPARPPDAPAHPRPALPSPAAMCGLFVSGLDRLVEAMEAAEASEALSASASARVTATVAVQAARRAAPRPPPPTGFVCPVAVCGRVFSKRYNQQAHMRLHDGTRPFSCPLCTKTFMWKSSLKSHSRMHAKNAAAGPVPVLTKKQRKAKSPALAARKARTAAVAPAPQPVAEDAAALS